MKRLSRKDIRDILVIVVALAVPLLLAWSVRPRPLSASTVTELHTIVRNSRQDAVLNPMSRRYEGMSLNFEGPDRESDATLRWQEIQASLQNSGVTGGEAGEIVRSARPLLGEAWPCFAERGYFQGQPAWFIVGSSPSYTGFIAWICPPSAQDIRREKIRKYCHNIQVVVVSAQSPFPVLN